MGTEKESCASLINKYFALKGTKQSLSIISACCFDSVPNTVYVEAYKNTHVMDAIKGLQNFF